jgi:hypothetical protein
MFSKCFIIVEALDELDDSRGHRSEFVQEILEWQTTVESTSSSPRGSYQTLPTSSSSFRPWKSGRA